MPHERDIPEIQKLFQRLRELKRLRQQHERGNTVLRLATALDVHAEMVIPMAPDMLAAVHAEISRAIESVSNRLNTFGFNDFDAGPVNQIREYDVRLDPIPALMIVCTNGAVVTEPLHKHPAIKDMGTRLAQAGFIVDDGAALQFATADGFYKVAVPQPFEE